jgi:hypothetical protein
MSAEDVGFAKRLRELMSGPPDPDEQLQAIQEIVNARIDKLRAKHADRTDGAASGSEPES